MTQKLPVEPLQCARTVVDIASDYQASDIVMLDISQVSGFADFFVILTAESVVLTLCPPGPLDLYTSTLISV